jgi:NAD(P)-dependent dehydrogenase (short-subunit alcohol dehydrogenase family)
MIDLSGARVVVTGAGGGVGRALCATLARLGAQIVACDVPGTDLAGEAHHFDLRDRTATLAAAGAILTGGTPSVVISNAGWTRADTFNLCTPDAIDDELASNFTGAAHFTQAFLPAMRVATGNRAFVFVSSVNALTHHGNPPYSAAKAAMLAWSRAIAVEEGRHGIRSNAVIPASIRTAAWEHRLQADPAMTQQVGGDLSAGPDCHHRRGRRGRGLPRLARRQWHHRHDADSGRRADGREPAVPDGDHLIVADITP